MLNFLNFGDHLEFWQKLKKSFISKTVRVRVISSYFLTIWLSEIFGILPLKNVKFLKFRPPSSVLSEIKNVGYLKNLQRSWFCTSFDLMQKGMGWTLHMIMCVLLCYSVSFHMLQLLLTGRPISSFVCSDWENGPVDIYIASAVILRLSHKTQK